jgi:hypothetical protein
VRSDFGKCGKARQADKLLTSIYKSIHGGMRETAKVIWWKRDLETESMKIKSRIILTN